MTYIKGSDITESVARLCIKSNIYQSPDIKCAFEKVRQVETKPIATQVMDILIENAEVATRDQIPICQDTGMTVVFLEIGQDVHIEGNLRDAVNKGVEIGYREGYLRKSVVADPINRKNTGDNTPAVIHYDIVPGDRLKITVAPKGFGSENMSALKMLKPSQGIEGVKSFVVETVKTAGSNPCPPIIVGVGVGGTMEMAAIIAKKALLRPIGSKNPDEFWSGIEEQLLSEINLLNIGPAGFGGVTTAMAVNVEVYATHIAGLPVAVNIGCHVTRHAEEVL